MLCTSVYLQTPRKNTFIEPDNISKETTSPWNITILDSIDWPRNGGWGKGRQILPPQLFSLNQIIGLTLWRNVSQAFLLALHFFSFANFCTLILQRVPQDKDHFRQWICGTQRYSKATLRAIFPKLITTTSSLNTLVFPFLCSYHILLVCGYKICIIKGALQSLCAVYSQHKYLQANSAFRAKAETYPPFPLQEVLRIVWNPCFLHCFILMAINSSENATQTCTRDFRSSKFCDKPIAQN